MRTLLTLWCALFVFEARAGVRVGNAAHVMHCKGRANVVLLDLWQAEAKHGLTLSTFSGLSSEQITNVVLARMGQRFPTLAEELGKEFRFYNTPGNNSAREGRFIQLPHYADELPSECDEPVTSAFQRDPIDSDDTLYNYSAPLRAKMDETTFAAQSYHEVAYQLGIRHGLDHPVGIRHLTGLAFSDQFASAPDVSWLTAFKNSFIDLFQVEGQWLPIFDEPLKTCNPNPRRVDSCTLTVVPALATVEYDKAGMLTSIAYSTPRLIPLGDAATATVAIETSHVKLVREADLKAFKFQGRVLTTDRAGERKAVNFKGFYTLNSKLLCGRLNGHSGKVCHPAADFFGTSVQRRAAR